MRAHISASLNSRLSALLQYRMAISSQATPSPQMSHDLRHDLASFQLTAAEIEDLYRSALPLPRIKHLAESLTTERVGSLQNLSCAPEILL